VKRLSYLHHTIKYLIGEGCSSHSYQPAAQHRLQLTPLARLQTQCVFHGHCVPSAVPSRKPASGAADRCPLDHRQPTRHLEAVNQLLCCATLRLAALVAL